MESSSADRVIVLVDMDCFYVQVEQKLCPGYENKPCAVAQYKTWKGGGIIAVNYEARAEGVTKIMRGDEAKEKCPDIHLFRVPEVRGKADLTRYRDAGALVIDVLSEYSDCVERASIDEAYLDMTSVIRSKVQNSPPVTADQLPNTFVIGWEDKDPEIRKNELQKWLQMIYEEDHLYNDRMLAVAAVIVEEMRTAVYEKLGFRCSAGIAHNKMLAKLTCGINKPNKQTVLPQSSIQLLFKTMPIKKVRNLGGKLGGSVRKKFNVDNMGDLIDVPRSQFVSYFGEKTGNWLYNLVRGIENEPVTSRQLPKSIGCGKNFPGKGSLGTKDEVTYWLKQLSSELGERLIKDQNNNKRFARLLTLSVRNSEKGYSSVSRSCPIHVYDAEKLAYDALATISKLNTSSSETLWKPNIYTLSMSASKFEDRLVNYCNIQSFLVNRSPERKEAMSNEVESPSSTASVSVECNRTDESLNSTVLKSPKTSGKSIASFFARKKIAEIKSIEDTAAVSTHEDQNPYLKDDQNSSDGLVTDDTIETLPDDEVNEQVCIEENSKDQTEKPAKSIGFFAKKLAERAEFNFEIDFETSCDTDSMSAEQLRKENENSLQEINYESMPSTSSVPDICPELDPELTKLCDQCHKRIPVWEEIEHLDYHMALNLSKEISKPLANNSLSSIKGKSTAPSKSKGRGRKRGSASKSSSQAKKISIQKNTLDAFIK